MTIRFEVRGVLAFWILWKLSITSNNHVSRFLRCREQLSDSFSLVRQNQIRPDVGQRLEDELSQVHPRVRQLQSFVVDLAIAAVQEVDVYCTRDVFLMIALPA